MTAVRVSVLNPANLLTFFRILLVPVYLWLFARGTWGSTTAALTVFVIAALTDLVDGRLARQRKEVTKLGRFMDPLADKFLVVGALVQFWLLGLVNTWLVGIIVVRDVWVTMMRVVALAKGTEMKTSGNAKLKTGIQLTVVITTIVFNGARQLFVAMDWTVMPTDPAGYRLVFDALLLVAVVFTIYSWAQYLYKGTAIKGS